MANFEVIRIHKHKSRVGIVRSLKHCFREQETPNADPEKTPENDLIDAENTQQAMAKYSERIDGLDRKVRKNAVHAVEFLVTASPEKMAEMTKKEQDKFFKKSLKYIEDKHGKENIFSSAVHRDETTPHLSVFVVPITKENKLSCKQFYGEQGALNKLQTDFHKSVGKSFDMTRGIEKSGVDHVSIKDYYTRINTSEKQNEFYKPQILESKKDFAKRVLDTQGTYSDKYDNLIHKYNEKVDQLSNVTKDRDHNKAMKEKAFKMFHLIELDPYRIEKLHHYANELRKERDLELKKERERAKALELKKRLGKKKSPSRGRSLTIER